MPKRGKCDGCTNLQRRGVSRLKTPAVAALGESGKRKAFSEWTPVHVFSTTKLSPSLLTIQTVAPLRSFGFAVELSGVGKPHAAFFTESRIHGRCRVPSGRKSGYAPVAMTMGRVRRWPRHFIGPLAAGRFRQLVGRFCSAPDSLFTPPLTFPWETPCFGGVLPATPVFSGHRFSKPPKRIDTISSASLSSRGACPTIIR
jgi:hypothetical protein